MPERNPPILTAAAYEALVEHTAQEFVGHYIRRGETRCAQAGAFAAHIRLDYPPMTAGRAVNDGHLRAIAWARAAVEQESA